MNKLIRGCLVLAAFAASGWPSLAAEESARQYSVAELDQRPKGLDQPPPMYPYALSRAGLIGRVTVQMIIGTDGRVEDAMVVNSNNPWFERPALDAVLRWKFSPGLKNGKPVKVRANQLIEFALDGGREVKEYWEVSKGKNQDQLPAEFQWDEPPRVLATAYPVYPFEQLQAKTRGVVQLRYVIGKSGKVVWAKLTEGSSPEFGQAALAMLNDWKFLPAKKAGQPCAALLSMKIDFSPGGDDVPVSNSAKSILKELARPAPRIYGGGALDQPLKPVFRRKPDYPVALQEQGLSGEALIEFYIDEKGDAQLPRIVTSTSAAFGYTAAQAVARWRFKPPMKDGKPVIARVQVPVKFAAKKEAPPNMAEAQRGKTMPETNTGNPRQKPEPEETILEDAQKRDGQAHTERAHD